MLAIPTTTSAAATAAPKPKKRLSAGMGLPPDGIDPLFEFDVPRLFVDLTAPPRWEVLKRVDGILPHDPWFDLDHPDHSRPTEEIAAEEQRQHVAHAPTGSAPNTNTTVTGGGATSALGRRRSPHTTIESDGEKENRNQRATVRKPTRGLRPATTAPSSSFSSVKRHLGPKRPLGGSTGAVRSTATSRPTVAASSRETTASVHVAGRKRRPMPGASGRAHKPAPPGGSGNDQSGSTGHTPLEELQQLLAQHNKRFKSTHTYEPRQHSVRDVRMWERETNKSYYHLTSDERVQANQEITALKRRHVAT